MIPHTIPPLIEGPSTPTVAAVPNSIAADSVTASIPRAEGLLLMGCPGFS